jgi:hypothetical protein
MGPRFLVGRLDPRETGTRRQHRPPFAQLAAQRRTAIWYSVTHTASGSNSTTRCRQTRAPAARGLVQPGFQLLDPLVQGGILDPQGRVLRPQGGVLPPERG